MMEEVIYTVIGKYVCYIGAIGIVLMMLMGVLLIVNRAVWALIGCIGGMNTFWRCARWYHAEGKRKETQCQQ